MRWWLVLVLFSMAGMARAQPASSELSLRGPEIEQLKLRLVRLDAQLDDLKAQRPSSAAPVTLVVAGSIVTASSLCALIVIPAGAASLSADLRPAFAIVGSIGGIGVAMLASGITWAHRKGHEQEPYDIVIKDIKQERKQVLRRLMDLKYDFRADATNVRFTIAGRF